MAEDEQYDLPSWTIVYPAPNDWRKYASEELQEHWTSFSLAQRRMIGRCLQEVADRRGVGMTKAEESEVPGPVDSTKVDWQRCNCGGKVALYGRTVLHDVPSCEEYQQLMVDAGARIHLVKDIGRN